MKTILTTISILAIIGCFNRKNKSIEHLKAGKEYYFINRYDSSMIHLKNSIKYDSLNSEAYYYMAKVNEEIGNYNNGIKYIDLANKHKIFSDSIDILKSEILQKMYRYDECIEFCDLAINRNNLNYKMYLEKARALFNKSNRETNKNKRLETLYGALDNVNIVLKLNKLNNESITLRGIIRYGMNDYKGAIKDFDTVIYKYKNDSTIISKAYRYKGLSQKRLKNYIHAELLLDSAIIYNKRKAVLYANRGDIRSKLKKMDLACEDYKIALEFGYEYAIETMYKSCQ
jgi:tetratricopeptide (TPR) repeat protein